MKGYIYRLYGGSDPANGWVFNDPIFGSPPTLGACVPNIRRNVEPGDWVFCISGRVPDRLPYVVGGFRVREKITALQAYGRFPEYRLTKANSGQTVGNVIVDQSGKQHPLDNHRSFERRLTDYLVGDTAVQISSPAKIERARQDTVAALSRIFKKPANRSFDIVPRWRRMDEEQVENMTDWVRSLSE